MPGQRQTALVPLYWRHFSGYATYQDLVVPSDDNFRVADEPSGGKLITAFERYGDLSPTIGFVLRLLFASQSSNGGPTTSYHGLRIVAGP